MDGGLVITSSDVVKSIRESAMLADVGISVWSAERTDRAVTERVKSDAGATGAVGRFIKNLLAGADKELKEVHSAYHKIRAIHMAMTLPWASNPGAQRQRGERLLPNLLFGEYTKALADQRNIAISKRDAFGENLPALIQDAANNLGTLVDPNEYPSVPQVMSAFHVHVDFRPLPEGSQFRGLPEFTLQRLSKALDKRQQDMAARAAQEMWSQARERVEHVVAQLGNPESRVYQTTLDHARGLLTLMPGWDFANDPRVGEIVQDIKKMLDGVEAAEIRKNSILRSGVASQAQALVEKLNRYGL